jgi:GxxExxY protein
MGEILYKEESFKVMGACFEVYKEKGAGFVEPIYHECLEIEFELSGVPAVHHPGLALSYKGRPLKRNYEADFVAYSKILLEVKACKGLDDSHRAQVVNYLKATGMKLGILVNFGRIGGLEWERIVLADWLREQNEPPNLHS